MFFVNFFKKKIILELHHDIKDESRIVRFLVKKTKFFNSKHIIKLIAITKYAKNNYITKHSVIEDRR